MADVGFDGIFDGKFTVGKGSNFTKALSKELGLSAEQQKELGSVWNQIYDLAGGVEELNNVKEGQEFDLSGVFDDILKLVHTNLSTKKKSPDFTKNSPATSFEEAVHSFEKRLIEYAINSDRKDWQKRLFNLP